MQKNFVNFKDEQQEDIRAHAQSLHSVGRSRWSWDRPCWSSYPVPSFQRLSEVLIAIICVCTLRPPCNQAPLSQHCLPWHTTRHIPASLWFVFLLSYIHCCLSLFVPFPPTSAPFYFAGVSDGQCYGCVTFEGKDKCCF